MDFNIIFQLRSKKFWWMDVIFYFVISLLVATVLCWVIFIVKNDIQRDDIKQEAVKLQGLGTDEQKSEETDVLLYRKKISDFASLFENHEFASNVFAFMENQTRPNIWFSQFNLDEKGGSVQLSGQADTMDDFSRQTAVFENNKYVKSVDLLSSNLGEGAKVNFGINLTLDQKIFNYVSDLDSQTPIVVTTSSSSESPIAPEQTDASGKLITLFNLPLNPEVVGNIDQTNYIITFNLPSGTNVTSIAPAINISTGATISPESGAAQNFTSPVVYTVTAQDGSIQNYTTKVNFASPPPKKSSAALSIIVSIVVIIFIVVAAVLAWFLYFKKKLIKKKQTV